MTESIADTWSAMCRNRSRSHRYFDQNHPLDLIYGADQAGHPLIALITDAKPDADDLSRDVRTVVAQREDGRWAVTWTLTDNLLMESFFRLGEDVARRSMSPAPGLSPTTAFFAALSQWQLLLRPPAPRRLSPDRLRGLVAELWTGRHLISGRTTSDVVAAWTGPLGADHDFTFVSGERIEVKAKRPTATKVGIASARQLDPQGGTLTLVVVDLDHGDPRGPETFTLVDLVEAYRQDLSAHPYEYDLLGVLLEGLGVDLNDEYYAEQRFLVVDTSRYDVTPTFPSLTGDNLPPSIASVRYDLDLHAVEPWLVAIESEDRQ